MKKFFFNILKDLIFLIILLSFWFYIVIFFKIPKYILPLPDTILKEFLNTKEILFKNLLVTLLEVIIGISISLILGIILGIIVDKIQIGKNYIIRVLVGFQTIPLIVLAPIFSYIFGVGLLGRINLIILMSFFTIMLTTLKSLKNISSHEIDIFKVMKANSWQIYKYLKIPRIIPQIFTGLDLILTYAMSAAIISEFIGSDSGLGFYLTRAYSTYNIPLVWLIVIVIIIITIILLKINKIIRKIFFKKYFY